MTRGTLYAITEKLVVETIEFNGGMFPEERGKEIIAFMENCKVLNDFRIGLEKFNKDNHSHEGNLFNLHKRHDFIQQVKNVDTIDMTKDYSELFFSDWTFWINLTKEDIVFKVDKGKYVPKNITNLILKSGECVAINYGDYEDHYKTSEECEKVIIKRHKEAIAKGWI